MCPCQLANFVSVRRSVVPQASWHPTPSAARGAWQLDDVAIGHRKGSRDSKSLTKGLAAALVPRSAWAAALPT